ncbi:hypothetical protein KKA47_04980 [bacterium]|nr:hypothetical protein [bacterium]
MIGALIKFSRSPAGKKILYDTYSITGLELAYDSDYAAVREILQTLGKSVEEVVPGGLTFYSKNVLGIEREM